MEERDLHYFITRIVNPDLNWIAVSLRSERRVVHGRIGYTGVKWVDKTPGDYIAERLEEWRDNLWYRYEKDFPANGEAILDEYFAILLDAELAFYGGENSAVQRLWELAERMGEYLGLKEYVVERRAEIGEQVRKIVEESTKTEYAVPTEEIGSEELPKKGDYELERYLYEPVPRRRNRALIAVVILVAVLAGLWFLSSRGYFNVADLIP